MLRRMMHVVCGIWLVFVRSTPGWSQEKAYQKVIATGSVGAFSHGTKVHACYIGSRLTDIQLRGTPFSSHCDRIVDLVHAGLDIVAPQGTAVQGVANGTVSDVVNSKSDVNWSALGFAVFVRHDRQVQGRDTYSAYFHFQNPPSVKPGDRVIGGTTQLGFVGATGAAFGPHTHFEIRHFSSRLSPQWLNIYGRESGPNPTFQPADFATSWEDPLAFSEMADETPTTQVVDPTAQAKGIVANLYQLCNAGQYSEAEKLMAARAIKYMRDNRASMKLVCDSNTRNRTLAEATFPEGRIDGSIAVIGAHLTFRGSQPLDDNTVLIMESGSWRVTFDSPTSIASSSGQPTRQAALPRELTSFPRTKDRETGATIVFGQKCPSSLEALMYAGQEIPFKIIIDVPSEQTFLTSGTLDRLTERAIAFGKTVCGKDVVITKAELTFLGPNNRDLKSPAALARYGGGIYNAMRSGQSESIEMHNYIGTMLRRTKFKSDFKVEAEVAVEDLAANPFAYQGKVVALLADFETMDSPTLGLFRAPASTTNPQPSEMIAINGISSQQFVHGRQRVAVAARVSGKTEKEYRGERIPLLIFVGVHICPDLRCSDIIP